MGEPLKDRINQATVERLAARLGSVASRFDEARFVERLCPVLADLELKDRVAEIATAMAEQLPDDYRRAVSLVVEAGDLDRPELRDFDAWPLCTFVELYGPDFPSASLDAMERLTVLWTCEFAIRPFLLQHPEETFARLGRWAHHPDPAVRRLVSEGTRPRLPWGAKVPVLVADPGRSLALLEVLWDDPSEDVRRSVANHLNDVSIDHPDLVVDTVQRFSDGTSGVSSSEARRALRTLVKRGHPGALELLGFTIDPIVEVESFACVPGAITLGETLELSADIRSAGPERQFLVVDYVIHHVKARGGTSPKVFKWSTRALESGETVRLAKSHPIRPITTRRYHAGLHRVELQVAGSILAATGFELSV